VGFVAGALPGEEVEAEVEEVRRNFWRGRAVGVIAGSRDRVLAPFETCTGCDWGHFDLAAAREAKRELFFETMQRIGKLAPQTFGELPVTPSPPGYRLRNRFHVSGRGAQLQLGHFIRRTHRIEPVGSCGALSPGTASLLPEIRESLAASGAGVSEISTLEDFSGARRLARVKLGETPKRQIAADADAVVSALSPLFDGVKVAVPEGRTERQAGLPRLVMEVGGRMFLVSVETFFQGNRHLAADLLRYVGRASGSAVGEALDAFGGVGFFAATLLDAGHSVTSVEGSPSAARDAARTRPGWADSDRWRIVPSSVAGYLAGFPRRFDVVVADPPRAGLARLARPLAQRARRRLVYVSCEPTTLARDLPEILSEGFAVLDARLYDLFPLTHRVEAVITLAREGGGRTA